MRRRPWILGTLLAGPVLAGCQVSREMQEQYVDLKNETRYQLTLMDTQSKFLQDKIDLIAEKMDRLEASQNDLARGISNFAHRPEQVKVEILEEVDTRSATIAMNQDAYVEDFGRRREEAYTGINRGLDAELDGMRATLQGEDEFFRFVFAYQDSMNAVFAGRFDHKPWYTSILSRWEDSKPANTPPIP